MACIGIEAQQYCQQWSQRTSFFSSSESLSFAYQLLVLMYHRLAALAPNITCHQQCQLMVLLLLLLSFNQPFWWIYVHISLWFYSAFLWCPIWLLVILQILYSIELSSYWYVCVVYLFWIEISCWI